jgi:hypothetical protein
MTYTEADAYAQYDKLLSAFDTAEWSEEHFDNRALFSDYYLTSRLPDMAEWEEDPRPAFGDIGDIYGEGAARWSRAKEAEVRQQLLLPALDVLGYRAEEAKRPDSEEHLPDYRLYRAGAEGDEPLCLCLAYTWGRSLDGKDYTRDTETPEENPGAAVVSVLRESDADFAIVTNGKLWRLYSTKTHSMASRFYQVDLPEILARRDPSEAFRYFWLLFRARAFESRIEVVQGEEKETCFAEWLIDQSREYARELGERLKERVFEEIFPHFADGFITRICERHGREPEDLTEDELDQVYQGTLTLLYRLLFLLYAESRALLPVRETRGYYDVSLEKMKKEIAERAGDLTDQAPGKLQKAYAADQTDLYSRLQDLFAVIAEGRSSLNVPTYNGGLFITRPEPEDDRLEAQTARFLDENAIPDRHLALGLDLMARDRDEKTQGLVFIDYKSLGVRQLGSIYEGMLEFKVRVAAENLCVVKEKGTYKYKPKSDLTKAQREKLPKARATTVQKGPRKGDVYLENDKRERKATGSYYTPDYIVKYIVEHTVGPVLEEKFGALRPKLRNAEKTFAANKSRIGPVEGYTRRDAGAEAFDKHRDVVEELFDVKVLDPAMGSGHFLVEVVDFITDRMIDFLNAYPWNPVLELLEQTRRTIREEMDDQNVTIDPERLTDVNLLKRHVLKRCVYGVDLNPMAVELAKVSLWLDCFTLGAPLSFLDHHLRCGNSLVGTDVKTVQKEVEGRRHGKEHKQLEMFASLFTGLERATEAMAEVGRLTDTTVQQVHNSQKHYKNAQKLLEPFKGLLNVWVSQWFGNEDALDALRLYPDQVDKAVKVAVRAGDRPKAVSEDVWDVARNALRIGQDRRIFHWELEFPEVWHAQRQSEAPGGFDAVVGNPPYDEVSAHYSGHSQHLQEFFSTFPGYAATKTGRVNLYRLFCVQATELLSAGGLVSYITPLTLLSDSFSYGTRDLMFKAVDFERIEAFPQKDDPARRVFTDAKQSTAVFVARNAHAPDSVTRVRVHPGREIADRSPCYVARQNALYALTPSQHAVPLVGSDAWNILEKRLHPQLGKLASQLITIYAGEICDNAANSHFLSDEPVGPQVLRGANIGRYELVPEAKQGEPRYLRLEQWTQARGDSERGTHYKAPRIGFQKGAAVDNWRRLIATMVPEGEHCFDTIGYIPEESTQRLHLWLALLNSALWEFRFRATSTTNHVNAYELGDIVVPGHVLDSDDSRFLEDAAANMLGLHAHKQELVGDFLAQLDGLLRDGLGPAERRCIGDLTGRTRIRNPLGDYQRGEAPLSWDALVRILCENRVLASDHAEVPAWLGSLRGTHESLLSTGLQLEAQMADLDDRIDETVFALYQLNDREADVVRAYIE